ncbi:MAG: CBS domain-containing protein, partial [Candidatus Micrarchaeia archaeon]
LSGHFKALPVLKSDGLTPEGEYTRAEMMRELIALKLIPAASSHSFMTSPVMTVDHNAKVSEAKSIMKANGLNKLVVTRSGIPVGLISTHDFAAYLLKPKQKKGREVIAELTNPNDMPVSNFMRDIVPSVSEESMLTEAIQKMADGNFSSILVVSDHSAKGVISATDIFRQVITMFSNPADVLISGLNAEDMRNKDDIKEAVLHIVSKFEKSFSMSGINLHFKKGKSVYLVQMHLKVENEPLSFSAEAHSIKEAMDIISNELHSVLVKKKDKVKNRVEKVR